MKEKVEEYKGKAPKPPKREEVVADLQNKLEQAKSKLPQGLQDKLPPPPWKK